MTKKIWILIGTWDTKGQSFKTWEMHKRKVAYEYNKLKKGEIEVISDGWCQICAPIPLVKKWNWPEMFLILIRFSLYVDSLIVWTLELAEMFAKNCISYKKTCNGQMSREWVCKKP